MILDLELLTSLEEVFNFLALIRKRDLGSRIQVTYMKQVFPSLWFYHSPLVKHTLVVKSLIVQHTNAFFIGDLVMHNDILVIRLIHAQRVTLLFHIHNIGFHSHLRCLERGCVWPKSIKDLSHPSLWVGLDNRVSVKNAIDDVGGGSDPINLGHKFRHRHNDARSRRSAIVSKELISVIGTTVLASMQQDGRPGDTINGPDTVHCYGHP
jgi:hypothetical protein